jgi:membrane-bound lytic murein transglycosylase
MVLMAASSSALADVPLQPVKPDTGQVTDVPLQPVKPEAGQVTLDSLGFDDQLWGRPGQPGDRQALLKSIDYSLRYLASPSAAQAYRRYPVPGITRDRVRRSLVRFRQLVVTSRSPAELQAAVNREFVFYKSVGRTIRGQSYSRATLNQFMPPAGHRVQSIAIPSTGCLLTSTDGRTLTPPVLSWKGKMV